MSIVAVLKALQHIYIYNSSLKNAATYIYIYVIAFFKNIAIDYLLQSFLEPLHCILNK